MACFKFAVLLIFMSIVSATSNDQVTQSSSLIENHRLPPSTLNQTAETLCGKLNFFFVYIPACRLKQALLTLAAVFLPVIPSPMEQSMRGSFATTAEGVRMLRAMPVTIQRVISRLSPLANCLTTPCSPS